MNLPEYKEKLSTDIIRKRTGIPPYRLIIVYQGMLMKGRGLEKVIEAMKYLDNYALVIIGEGADENSLKQSASVPELRRKVHFIGAVPYSELHEWTCGADIGYCFIEPISFSYELALPNKLFEYAMAGVPSLTSSLPAIDRILEKSGIGLSIPHYSGPEAIAEAIKAIGSENLRNKLIANCSKAAKIYSYESQEDKVLGILD
jgi:glycosyltransferase involved in cell wall biosynthesis